MAQETIYTIPLRKVFQVSKTERTRKAINVIRDYVKSHKKCEEIKIDNELNKFLWSRGISNPPRKIRVKVEEEEIELEGGEREKMVIVSLA